MKTQKPGAQNVRSGNIPALLLERNTIYIIIGKRIVSQLEEAKLDEGVLALLASFYLLDFDYPRCHEISLTFLQQCTFKDMSVPTDITASFQLALSNYNDFKTD